MDMRESKWRKYKSDFLRANRCTVDEFERDYIAFQEAKPNQKVYRQFARKYNITIHPDPNIPADLQVVLCVNTAAVKVMAQSEREAYHAIADIIESMRPVH